MNLREIVRDYHPRKHVLYILFLVLVVFYVSIKLQLKIPEYDAAMKDNYLKWENFQNIVLYEPIREELQVRLLPWLILVSMMFLRARYLPARNFLNSEAVLGLSALWMLFWIPLSIVTAFWAAEHAWPLITFAMGIVMGAMIFSTRDIYYAIPGIFLVMIFHVFCNLCSFMGSIVKIHILQ